MKRTNILIYLIAFFSFISSSSFAQDGTLDPTFGDSGIVTNSLSDDSRVVKSIGLLDGKILVVTYIWQGNTTIARYNSDGSPDNTFGNNGVREFIPKNNTVFVPHDVAVDKNGKIVIVGLLNYTIEDHYEKILLYFNADGVLDNLIGDGGIITFVNRRPTIDHQEIITISNDNKILLAHTLDDKLTIKRYNEDGTTDFSFGTSGSFTSAGNYYPFVMKLDWEGNIFMLFFFKLNEDPDYKLKVLKLNKDGQIIEAFADNGILTSDNCRVPYSYSDLYVTHNLEQLKFDGLLLMRNGGITITGGSLDEYENTFNIEQYNADGILNTAFGNDGITKVLFDENLKLKPYNCGLLPHGEIAISGYGEFSDATNAHASFITKITKYGGMKSNFGTNGITLIQNDLVSNNFWDIFVIPEDYHLLVTNFTYEAWGNRKQSFFNYINSKEDRVNHFSGEVSGDWDIDTAYIDGDIYIPENRSLVIAPGTNVYFTGKYNFDVYGQLFAEGTKLDSISFFSDTLKETNSYPYYEGFWYGITFHSTDENGQAPSTLDYCNIKYAYERWLDEASSQFNRRFGGGLIFYKSTINVSNTKLSDCHESSSLGGVFTSIYSSGNIKNVSMLRAGSITLLSSDANIESLNMNGGFGFYADSSNVIIKNSIFENPSQYSGTGFTAEHSEVEMTDCEISDYNGDGIHAEFSSFEIEHVGIKNNGGDGAIFLESPSTIVNCEIIGNSIHGLRFQTVQNWGTIFTYEINNCVIAKNGYTGIKFWSRNTANITNCTIADNTNSSGWGGVLGAEIAPQLKNCIVWNNGSDLNYQAGGLYTYSIIQGNYVGSETATTNFQNADPLFRDAANNDYRLQSIACGGAFNSPGIDTGDPTIADLVLDCETAGLGTYSSDIGAYGGQSNWWDKTIVPPCHYQGVVYGVWECEDIYIDGDIIVPIGREIIVSPSVKTVHVSGPYQIKVKGMFKAEGSEDQPIVFKGEGLSDTDAWHGIYFSDLNDNEYRTSKIDYCRFENANKLTANYPNGGALLIYNSDKVEVKNTKFISNNAQFGGAVSVEYSSPIFENCTFEANGVSDSITMNIKATAGGAMFLKSSNPTLRKLKFIKNGARGGGAILMDGSSPTLSNTLLVQNKVSGLGGAIELLSNIVTSASPTFVNMTSSDNIAEVSGGTFHLMGPNSNPEIINSIMYNNSKPELYIDEGTPSITYSIIDAAASESYFGEGCLDENPYFATGSNYRLSNNTCAFSDGNTVLAK